MTDNVCFKQLVTGIIPPERMNCPYYYQPHPLCLMAAAEVQAEIEAMTEWKDEVEQGKMFGILVVKSPNGQVGYLRAYSGQILGREDWQGWVAAIFDYLQPDGYFCQHEAEITAVNQQITNLQHSVRYAVACRRFAEAECNGETEIEDFKKMMSEKKTERDRRRAEGCDEAELTHESQFLKAELRRLKKRVEDGLIPLRNDVQYFEQQIASLKTRRKEMSDALQRWLFSQFVVVNGKGERTDLLTIFSPTPQSIPPSGAGECCAPKLLQYAFLHNMKPLAIAEFWWGASPVGEIRHNLDYYPACQGKCRPILDFMLQGIDVEPNPLEEGDNDAELEVVYEDNWLIVINKPAGMLSVPGKSQRKSALELLEKQRNSFTSSLFHFFTLHRLDMQTSGLLMFAKTEEMQKTMQKMFASREVKKRYVAVLEGEYKGPKEGDISLPLSADYLNRPRQKVDKEHGKAAVTHYIIKGVQNVHTLLDLYPQTGRTHQLRIHCAHPEGLGIPIIGDDLYGHHAERLMLDAAEITFRHPITHEIINIINNKSII